MSKNFTDRFQDASNVFHGKYRPSEISVDWDAYTKNREKPDETGHVAYIYILKD